MENNTKIIKKLGKIRESLGKYFIERTEEIDLALTALISGTTMLMIGPPGTAKSQLCRAIASHIDEVRYFEWLLTKFTTPEEIFGTLDLDELKKGRFVRKVEGKLPTAHIAFLDEIFKASSAILNSLLTIINERIYHNDGCPMKVPLITLYSASNELPDDESLRALYDRLVIRKVVEPIQDCNNWYELLQKPKEYTAETKLTLNEIQVLMKTIRSIDASPVINDLIKIRLTLKNKGIEISDRRFKQALDIVRAYALVRGNLTLRENHLEVLQHVFWEEPEQINLVRSTIFHVCNPLAAKATEYLEVLNEFDKELQKYEDVTPEVIEIYSKINNMVEDLKKIRDDAKQSRKDAVVIEKVLMKAEDLRQKITRDIIKISI